MATCSICLTDIEHDICRTIVCKHEFHRECLEDWLKIENSCPLCRNPIKRIYKAYSLNYNSDCVLKFKDNFFEFIDIKNKQFYKKFDYKGLKRVIVSKKNIKFSILDNNKMIDYKFMLDHEHKHMILKLVKKIIDKKMNSII